MMRQASFRVGSHPKGILSNVYALRVAGSGAQPRHRDVQGDSACSSKTHVRNLCLGPVGLAASAWADGSRQGGAQRGRGARAGSGGQGQPRRCRLATGLSTGADGYICIKTVDNGFLILQPNSDASIIAYQADSPRPIAASNLNCVKGGAQHLQSGGENAQQNFATSTPRWPPLACAGHRLTVFTDADHSHCRTVRRRGGQRFQPGCAPRRRAVRNAAQPRAVCQPAA